jgi:DNA damage-binding protein 1
MDISMSGLSPEQKDLKKMSSVVANGKQSMLFGTVNGMIGVIVPIEKDQYIFLLRVQNALNKIIKGVGGFSHKQWRTFENRRSMSEAKGFIDGDLIESFLDLKKQEMAQVVEILNNEGNMEDEEPFSIENLTTRIEEFAQLH